MLNSIRTSTVHFDSVANAKRRIGIGIVFYDGAPFKAVGLVRKENEDFDDVGHDDPQYYDLQLVPLNKPKIYVEVNTPLLDIYNYSYGLRVDKIHKRVFYLSRRVVRDAQQTLNPKNSIFLSLFETFVMGNSPDSWSQGDGTWSWESILRYYSKYDAIKNAEDFYKYFTPKILESYTQCPLCEDIFIDRLSQTCWKQSEKIGQYTVVNDKLVISLQECFKYLKEHLERKGYEIAC